MTIKQLPPYAIWGTRRVGTAFFERMIQQRKLYALPLFWVDSVTARQGKELYGVPIISPQEFYAKDTCAYIDRTPFAVVIAASGNNILDISATLERNQVRAEKYAALSLYADDYFTEHADEVQEVRALFQEDKSRRDYDTILENLRLGRPVDFLVYSPTQYFVPEVVGNLSDVSCYIDAGSCDGKEAEYVLRNSPHTAVYAFEPDNRSAKRLEQKFATNGHVHIIQAALWNTDEQLSFSQNDADNNSSRVSNVVNNNDLRTITCVGG